MKYPILTLKKIPSPYKSGNKVLTFHAHFEGEDNFTNLDQKEIRKAYLKSIKEEVGKVIEENNLISQAAMVQSNDEIFVIFRNNLDLKIFHSIIKNIFQELDEYVLGKLHYTYAFVTCLLVEEGKELGMFKIAKMGKELLDSEEYKKNTVNILLKKDGKHLKYLTSYEEFLTSYEDVGYDYYI